MNIEKAIKIERERNTFLQYKSDCWRNAAISLVEAIESKSAVDLVAAMTIFKIVKKMFPYKEI